MSVFLFVVITLVTFITMEGITWCTHKYVMHGFLWSLHEDHHKPRYTNVFEKNDLFFVIFATPSILLFYFGIQDTLNYLFFIGLGILLYGISYFVVHDVIIHQRLPWFKHTNIRYIKALRKAHKVHHKNMYKEDGVCFGMLFVPMKYFKEQYKSG